MFWKGKKVLVTGAGGFIGSHLVEHLVKVGADVTCFVRYNSRNDLGLLEILPAQITKNIRLVCADLKDEDAIYRPIKNQQIIFHLGALISIPYSYLNPRDFVQTNVLGTLNILMAALKNKKLEKVIQVSSSEVYGTALKVPIDEKHPLQPQSPYSASKIAADKIALSFYLTYGLPVSIIRPFNTYGPRQSGRAVIPAIMTQLLKNKRVKIGNLKPIRDFMYISDSVAGFLAVAESSKSIGEEINIGCGQGISIGDLAKKITVISGKKIRLVKEMIRVRPEKSEVFRLICDNSKAKFLLNWQPIVSLDNGLKLTLDWVRSNLSFYKSNIYNI